MEDRGTRVENDTPALVAAVQDGDLGLVMRLVQQGHSVRDKDKDGATALYWACSRGHTKISDFLISAGSDVNARVKWGATPLLAAADNGQEICTSQLLRNNADVNAANKRGDTPLHAAAYRGYVGVLCKLMEAGANPFLKNSASMTPLQEAFVQQKQDCVQRLQEYMNVHGFSGPISLPIPPQESTSSYTESLREPPYRSWPYVPPSNRSITSQTEPQTKSTSLRSPEMDIFEKSKIHSGNYHDRTTPLSEIRQCMNLDSFQPKVQSVKVHNSESVDDLFSFHKTQCRNLLHLSDSSISQSSLEGKRGNLSFDGLLRHAVSIPSKSGSQVLYNSGNIRPSSFPSIASQEATNETPGMENVRNLKKYGTNKEIQTAPIIVPRDRTPKSPNLTESASIITHSEASATRPTSGLNEASALDNRTRKTKHGSGKAIPGVNVSEFVENLQLQVIELQEKLIQSNAMIAQLKDQLIEVQRENNELKTDNLLLKNILQHDLSSDLITRGVSEICEGEQYTTVPPERLQSVARFVDRSGFDSQVDCRQAIESGECEDSPP